jgi:hypothetical protein
MIPLPRPNPTHARKRVMKASGHGGNPFLRSSCLSYFSGKWFETKDSKPILDSSIFWLWDIHE